MEFMLKKMMAVALIGVGLIGCGSGEPSEKDIREAFIKAEPAAAKDAEMIAKVGGCKEDGDKAYRCDVGSKDGTGRTLPIRFVKTDNGWRVSGS